MRIRSLDADDVGYALVSWQEAHKLSPECRKAPWWAYRLEYGTLIKRLVDDSSTELLGAYDGLEQLLGFLAMTRGKRMHVLHWCQIKNKLGGKRVPERRELFHRLVEAADLGPRFVYTLRGPRCRKETGVRSLDELLVADLRARGVIATYVSLKEWLK